MAAPYVVIPVKGEFDLGSTEMDQIAPETADSLKVTLERLLDEFLITDEDKLLQFAEARPFWINKTTVITKNYNERPIATPLQQFNDIISENLRSLLNERVGNMALWETDETLKRMNLEGLHRWLYLASMISKYSRLAGSFDIPYGVVFIMPDAKPNAAFEADRAPKTVPTVIVNTRDPLILKIYVLVARRIQGRSRETFVRPYGYMRLEELGREDQLLYHEYQIKTGSDKINIEKLQSLTDLTDLPQNYPTRTRSKVESLTIVTLPSVESLIQDIPQHNSQSKSTIPRGIVMSQGRYSGGDQNNLFIKLKTTKGLNKSNNNTIKKLKGKTADEERKFIEKNLNDIKKAPKKDQPKVLNRILGYSDADADDVELFVTQHTNFLRYLERGYVLEPKGKANDEEKTTSIVKPKEATTPTEKAASLETNPLDTPTPKNTPKDRAEKKKKTQEATATGEESPRRIDNATRQRFFRILKSLNKSDLTALKTPKEFNALNDKLGSGKNQATLIELKNYIAEIMSDAPDNSLFESDDLVIFYGKPTLLDQTKDGDDDWKLSGKEIAERIAKLKTDSDAEELIKKWKLDRETATTRGTETYMTEWGFFKNNEFPKNDKTAKTEQTKIQKLWSDILANLWEKAKLVRTLIDNRKKEIDDANVTPPLTPRQDATATPTPTGDVSDDEDDPFEDASEAEALPTPPDSPRETNKMLPIQEDVETDAEDTDNEEVEEFSSAGVRTPRPPDPNAPLLDKLLRLCMVDIVASFVGSFNPVAAIDATMRAMDRDTITAALFGALSAVYTGLDTSVNIRFQPLAERIGSARQTDLDLAPYLKSPLSLADQIVVTQLLSPTLRDEFLKDTNPFGIVPVKDGSVYGSRIFSTQAVLELCRESRELRPIIPTSNYYYPVAQQTTTFEPLFKFDISEPLVVKTDDDTRDQWRLVWFQAWRTQLFESYVSRAPPFAEALHTEAVNTIKNYSPPKDSVSPIISVAGFRDVLDNTDGLKGDLTFSLSLYNKGRHIDYETAAMGLKTRWGRPVAIFAIPSDKDETKFKHRITNESKRKSVDEAYGLLCSLWLCFSTMDIRIVEAVNPIVLVDILSGSYPLKDKPASSFVGGAINFAMGFIKSNEKVRDMPNVKPMIRPALQLIENEGKSAVKWSTEKTWLVLQALNFAARYRLGSSNQRFFFGEQVKDAPVKKASSFTGGFADFNQAEKVISTILSHVAEGEDGTDTWETVAALTRSATAESMNALRPDKVDVVNFIRSAMSASD